MHLPSSVHPALRVTAYLPLLLLALSAGRAQVAPAPSVRLPAVDETVTLSPFIISTERETGWSANDTLSATRTKQALKDVPVAIDAITSDFMEDLGLFTADEVANYVANVYAAPLMENDNQQGGFAFRGLRAGVLGSWRDDYLLGLPNGQEMVGGTSHPVNAYVEREQKIWGYRVTIRADVKNLKDLENSFVRKTGFTTMANGTNVYRYSYVMPPQYSLRISTRF